VGTFFSIRTADEELEYAVRLESRGMSQLAERHLYRALYLEREQADRELINRRRAERMARESDACMEHRTTHPDCPSCL